MTDYLLTCALISASALAATYYLENAPARLSFYVLITALLSWFVPWHTLSQLNVFSDSPGYVLDISKLNLQLESLYPLSKEPSITNPNELEPLYSDLLPAASTVLVWLCFIGMGAFFLRLVIYYKLLKNLKAHSTLSNHFDYISTDYPIRLTKLDGPAIATGLFKPVIWLDYSMIKRDEAESVLVHELTHLKQGDTHWTWLISMVESIFWWNPLCLKLAKQARQQLELRCDELCQRQLNNKYQLDLASLLLSQQKPDNNKRLFTPPLLSISHSSSFNIRRIKTLNKEKTMKSKYLLIATAAMSFSALAATQIVYGKSSKVQNSKNTEQVVKSELYNQQLNTLLSRVQGAKSEQSAELQGAANNILDWYQNRSPLPANEELEIKILSFTLINHIYHKLGQYQDSLNAYEKWYGQDDAAPYFLKNPLASTYMELGRHELAIQELESLSAILNGNLQPGSRISLARAYIEVSNYDKAMSLLSDSGVGDNTYANILKYYVYNKQNNHQKADELKAKIPDAYAVTPAMLPGIGIPGSPLLKQI